MHLRTWSAAALLMALTLSASAQSKTKIIDNGPDAGKRILVVLGDGYASADQTKYNTDVDNLVLKGVFANDFYRDHQNAFNVYRVNLISNQSGVSTRVYNENGTPTNPADDTIVSTTMRDTALRYIYSGSWAHCWMEGSSDTNTRIQNALNATVPNADYVLILLNNDGFGGCGGGGRQVVTRTVGWDVVAHEYGHGIGGLWDEYSGAGAYTGSATNNRNCSTVTSRTTNYWNRFINPSTPVPTTFGAGMDSNRTVGIFTGCGTRDTGIYRPVNNCRMRGNTPNFCPVCQTLMRKALYPYLAHNFNNAVKGDFNGDGRDDLLIKNGNDIAIYRTNANNTMDLVWIANNVIPNAPTSGYTWQQTPGDRFIVADWTGDGRDDVFIYNTSSWSYPYFGLARSNGTGLEVVKWYETSIGGYWAMKGGDRVFVADFDGDNKDDLCIFNGSNWSMPYFLLARSTGTDVAYTARYDGSFPGWTMRPNDRHAVGDFDGDNKDDVYIFNGSDWSYKYLGMLRSAGTGVSSVRLYTTNLPGWNMNANDQLHVADFDADGKKDLYVINTQDWGYAYLCMQKSTGSALSQAARYSNDSGWSGNIPGWSLTKGDRFWACDANKDNRGDLFVYNPATNWSTEYLGTLMSGGATLSGSWSADWVGGWNLGSVDQIIPSRYEGGSGMPDIFIRNNEWFGMIRRGPSAFTMDRIYYHWIWTPLYDSKPWSDSMP